MEVSKVKCCYLLVINEPTHQSIHPQSTHSATLEIEVVSQQTIK